jgi:hypothetical protein
MEKDIDGYRCEQPQLFQDALDFLFEIGFYPGIDQCCLCHFISPLFWENCKTMVAQSQGEFQAGSRRIEGKNILGREKTRMQGWASGPENFDGTQLGSLLDKISIEGRKPLRLSARSEMQGIGEIKPLLIPLESLCNGLLIFRLNIGNAEQLLERLGYDFPGDTIAMSQYPLGFEQHRLRDKDTVALHNTKSLLGFKRVIIGQESNQQVGADCDHDLSFAPFAMAASISLSDFLLPLY